MSAHVRAQVARFARLTMLALATQILLTGGHVPTPWPALWLLVPGVAETLLRQVARVEPTPVVTAVPAPPGNAP